MKGRSEMRPIGVPVVLLILAVGAFAQEKKITQKELPAPVLSSFQKTYPHATIKGVGMETENGKTYYEIESVDGKTNRDLLYLADGTVAEIEETAAAAELPASVKSTVTAEYPSGKIQKAEKTTRGSVVTYDVRVEVGTTKHEISIDAGGKVIKETSNGSKNEPRKESH
jgi:uncharacterized membrane protein YkoI